MKVPALFTVVLFTVVSICSCKKDSGSPAEAYYIKANIGGTQKTYTTNLVAGFSNASALVIAGSPEGSSGERLVLDVSKDDNIPLTTGTYTQTTAGEENGGQYYPTADMSVSYNAILKPSSNHPLVIILTQLDDKIIAGTFSGNFYKNGDPASDSLLISGGSFNLQRQ